MQTDEDQTDDDDCPELVSGDSSSSDDDDDDFFDPKKASDESSWLPPRRLRSTAPAYEKLDRISKNHPGKFKSMNTEFCVRFICLSTVGCFCSCIHAFTCSQ